MTTIVSTTAEPLVITETAPLSPGQERLIEAEFALPDGTWPAPGDGTRLRPIDTGAIHIDGPLNTAALQSAVSALVARQSALRTTFRRLPDGTPVQLVAARMAARVSESLLSVPVGAPLPVGELLGQAPAGMVDPRHDRLFRVRLVRLGEDRHVLLLQIHHMVSDGWSIGVLYRDLSALYNAAAAGRDADLPAVARSFAEVCRQMRRERGGSEEQRQLSYWRQRLAPPRPALAFTDRPAAPYAVASPVDVEPVAVAAELVRDLRQAAHSSEQRGGVAGPFLAALALVLHHQTAAADIRIGMMISNRARPDTEHLIGYFVNTAVIRLRVASEMTVGQLVAAANTAVTEAIEHQALPIQDLYRDLREAGGPGEAPLYQVTVAVNTMRTASLDLTALECRDVEVEALGPRLAPTSIEQRWVLEEQAGLLAGTLTYRTDTFSRPTILGCLGNLDLALRAVADRQATVSEIVRSFAPGRGDGQ